MKKILVFVNFTEASMQAFRQAIELGKHKKSPLLISHIDEGTRETEVKEELARYTEMANKEGVEISEIREKGDFYEKAPEVVKSAKPELVVIGSLGEEGFSIEHLGSAIYKVIRTLAAPSLVIQKDTALSSEGYRHAMLPLSSQPELKRLVPPLVHVMAPSGKVTLLGIKSKGKELDEALLTNANKVETEMEKHGIACERLEIEVSNSSTGLAEIILEEMKKGKMDLLSMPADISQLNRHFGKMVKEALIANTAGFPSLCVNTDFD